MSLFYFIEAESAQATLAEITGVGVPSGAACRWSVNWCADAAATLGFRPDPAVEARCSWSKERAATGCDRNATRP